MIKTILMAAALSVCSLATAAPQEFTVKYKGFLDAETNRFNPAKEAELSFSAEDLNGDGSYTIDEVATFGFGRIYASASWGSICSWPSCVQEFNYTPGSLPTYIADYYLRDERFSQSDYVVGGEYFTTSDSHIFGDSQYSRWEWTAATQTWVNGVPVTAVPEPATYAMLAAGLAAIFAARRRIV